jgi:hypothetical protein
LKPQNEPQQKTSLFSFSSVQSVPANLNLQTNKP